MPAGRLRPRDIEPSPDPGSFCATIVLTLSRTARPCHILVGPKRGCSWRGRVSYSDDEDLSALAGDVEVLTIRLGALIQELVVVNATHGDNVELRRASELLARELAAKAELLATVLFEGHRAKALPAGRI